MTYVIVSSGHLRGLHGLGALSPEPGVDLARRQEAAAGGLSQEDIDARVKIAQTADKVLGDIHDKLTFIINENFSLLGIGAKALGTVAGSAAVIFAGAKAATASVALASTAFTSAAAGVVVPLAVPAGGLALGAGMIAAGTAIVAITLPAFSGALQARGFLTAARDSLAGRIRANVKDICFRPDLSKETIVQRVQEFLREYAEGIDQQIKINQQASSIFTNAANAFIAGLKKVVPGLLPDPAKFPWWVWAIGGLVAVGYGAALVGRAEKA
jgi:hypothetical protein